MDAAILLIAFVIVAAGFAFVMVNMGFSSSQKSKTVIVSGLSSAGTGLQVSGNVIGAGHVSDARINVTGIPIKVASSQNAVDLDVLFTAIKYQGNNVKYDNIYVGTINPTTPGEFFNEPDSLELGTLAAQFFGYINRNPYIDNDWPSKTSAFVYWTINDNDNNVLDPNEHAVVAIVFSEEDRPEPHEKIRVEVIVGTGSALTVERTIPVFNTDVVRLG